MASKSKHFVERKDRHVTIGGVCESLLNLAWVSTEALNNGAETVYRASVVMDHANLTWAERKIAEREDEAQKALAALKAVK